jgi:hypothetical protein
MLGVVRTDCTGRWYAAGLKVVRGEAEGILTVRMKSAATSRAEGKDW